MNGGGSSYETPSTVTCCSCMHSSNAACVFGDARLISSTSKRFAKTGPGRNSNSFERWLKTLTPVTSDGSRSGVNCMRENETSSERASAFASIVLPTPGKSSRIKCPSLTRQRTQRRSVSSGAWTTRARLSTTARIDSAAPAVSTRWLPGSLTQKLLRRIYDRGRDSVFGRLRHLALGTGCHEDDFVLLGIEADVFARDVVVDDEVDALALQFLARTREAGLALVGREPDQHLAVRPPVCERRQDVRRRLEADVPLLLVLRPLLRHSLRWPIVGDRGGHQDDVDLPAGQRFGEHRFGRRRFDHLDARRRRHREVRSQEGDARTPSLRLRGERHSHPSRRAVPEEAHRVEWLARPTRAHEHTPSGQGVALAQELAGAPIDLVGLRHPAGPPLPFRGFALIRPDERGAARAHRLHVRLRRRMR